MQEIRFLTDDFKIVVREGRPGEEEASFHEEIEIKYFYEGNCALMIDSDIIFAQPGDITIANPYQVHSNVYIDKYHGKYGALIIGMDFLSDFAKELDLRSLLIGSKNTFRNHIQGDKRLQTIVLRVMEEMREQEENYRLIVRNLMCEFLALLVRSYLVKSEDDAPALREKKQMGIIAPALSKIHAEYQKKLTVEDLSSLSHVSKYHFCRIFKSVMNVTAVQYMMTYRLNLAEMMLKMTDKGIGEIAWQCGFEDEGYFSRCYKKIKGAPPKEVKKAYKKKTAAALK
jgi:AraC-like DNA-binding protein